MKSVKKECKYTFVHIANAGTMFMYTYVITYTQVWVIPTKYTLPTNGCVMFSV